LRPIADLDGDRVSTRAEVPVDCAALLATCAHKNTGADLVVRPLVRAASDWLAQGDVKRLRSALLSIVTNLD
jgi:hypothetical protein